MEAIVSATSTPVNVISAKRVAVLLAIGKSRKVVFKLLPMLMSTKWGLTPFAISSR